MRHSFISFFVLIFSVSFCSGESFDCSAAALHIWSDDSGSSWLYGFNAEGLFSAPAGDLSLSLDVNRVTSSLSVSSGDVTVLSVNSEYRGTQTGLVFSGGVLCGSDIDVCIDHHMYSVSKMNIPYGSISVPWYFGSKDKKDAFSVAPFFAAASMASSGGDFYWFWGTPAIPLLWTTGIQGTFGQYKGIVACGRFECLFDSNENANLIQSDIYFGGLFLQRTANLSRWSFSPYAGCGYINGYFDGSLTAENQLYMLFPYRSYYISGIIEVCGVLAGIDCLYRFGWLSWEIKSGILLFPYQRCSYSALWEYKNSLFFDGSSGGENSNLDTLDKSGIVAVSFDIEADMTKKRIPFIVNFSKTFLLPFKLQSDTSSGNGIGESRTIDGKQICSWLLSGISFTVKYVPN